MAVLSLSVPAVAVPEPSRRRAAVNVRRRVRPRPAIDINRMTRYRGGTYSHTVDTIVFTDGTKARTDLIRLNPNVEAYSLDFSAVAPMRPSHYEVGTWSAVPNLRAHAYEAEVDWILRNSYPTLGTGDLSRRLRAAGHPLGSANIAEHEAIAGTQAAIWYLTNGLELDSRPLNVPINVQRHDDCVVFDFEGQPELGGYTVDLATDATVTLTVQKSNDRQNWSDVTTSRLTIDAGKGTYTRTLGVGSTVSATRQGEARRRGYRFYRLMIHAPEGAKVDIADTRFRLNGSGHYRNPGRIVHLYNYLLDGARKARARQVAPQLVSAGAGISGGLIGPFRLQATDAVTLTASSGALVDAAGAPLGGPCAPGVEFYIRPESADATVTVTLTVPGNSDGFGGRVLTGVARDAVTSRFTPVALTVPAQLIVEFDLDWAAGNRITA